MPEKSEELKLKLIGILTRLTAFDGCLNRALPELASAAAKCLADDYDLIKNVPNL
jgi:hypothetical protein